MEVGAEVEAAAYELWRAWDVALGQMVGRCWERMRHTLPLPLAKPYGKQVPLYRDGGSSQH